MFCKNCGNEVNEKDQFCSNCGWDLSADKHDLYGVTKIPTFLFWLFSFLTLGIYYHIKVYRMTGDLRKLISKGRSVSYLDITALVLMIISGNFLELCDIMIQQELLNLGSRISGEFETYIDLLNLQAGFASLLILIVGTILYFNIIYKTLDNIKYIARQKQNKLLKYNKFWAFIFGFLYINFVFNTYDQRLCNIYIKKQEEI